MVVVSKKRTPSNTKPEGITGSPATNWAWPCWPMVQRGVGGPYPSEGWVRPCRGNEQPRGALISTQILRRRDQRYGGSSRPGRQNVTLTQALDNLEEIGLNVELIALDGRFQLGGVGGHDDIVSPLHWDNESTPRYRLPDHEVRLEEFVPGTRSRRRRCVVQQSQRTDGLVNIIEFPVSGRTLLSSHRVSQTILKLLGRLVLFGSAGPDTHGETQAAPSGRWLLAVPSLVLMRSRLVWCRGCKEAVDPAARFDRLLGEVVDYWQAAPRPKPLRAVQTHHPATESRYR